MKHEPITDSSGWNRECANVRLSKRRKENLMSISKELSSGSTPTDAIDYCIAIATADRRVALGIEDRFSQLTDMIESLSDMCCNGFGDQGSALRSLASDLGQVRELISGAASMPGGDGGFDEEAMLISQWLDVEAKAFGAASILVKAKWQSSARESGNQAGMVLLVERMAVAHYKGPARPSLPAMVKLDGIDAENPLIRTVSMREFYLACQRTAQSSWALSAHLINPDKTIGTALATIRQ